MFVDTCNVLPSLPMLSIQESTHEVANTLMILQCAQHLNCKFAMFFFVAMDIAQLLKDNRDLEVGN
jgi:hypothetical protein